MDAMIDAIYFDGRSAQRRPVTVLIHKRVLAMRGLGGLHRTARLSQLEVSERLLHAPRIVRFPDGTFFETSDPLFERMLRKNGYREPWAVRWQQNWPLSLAGLIVLLGTLLAGYQWGLPWAADRAAQHLPAALEHKIGERELQLVDQRYFGPSKLEATDRERLQRLFAAMHQPRGEHTVYRLEFRDSKIGPNAFALPNGVIVMTDQLVRMANNDQAVLGVLSHELGHLQRRHALRGLLQAVGAGAALHLLVGDVSTMLAALPTFLIDQKYSRDFEREADRYAIDMMRENGLPLTPLADLFVRMGQEQKDKDADKAAEQMAQAGDEQDEDEDDDEEEPRVAPAPGKLPRRPTLRDYFSSHPSDDERIARLRAADRS
jgi:Zn-dependent protease with chaperone function